MYPEEVDFLEGRGPKGGDSQTQGLCRVLRGKAETRRLMCKLSMGC